MNRENIISIIYNFLDMLNGVKIRHFEQPVNYYCRSGIKAFLNKSNSIARDINSSKYTKEQLINFLFITALLHGQKGIYAINVKDIIKIRRITEKYAKKDETIIHSICSKYKITEEDLMEIRDNGESILFKLVKTNHVSMAYVLKNYKKILTTAEKNAILFNTEYRTFHNLFKQFIQFIQGEAYAKV